MLEVSKTQYLCSQALIIFFIIENWHCNIDFSVLFIIYPFAFAFFKNK